MRFEQAIQSIIPVVAHERRRVRRVEVRRPEVGLRWGRPSSFYEPDDNVRRGGFTVGFVDEEIFVNGVEIAREYEEITVQATEEVSFQLETVQSVTFYTGTREERTEHKLESGAIQPVVETIIDHFRMQFPRQLPASSPRGEEPTPTPPRPDPGELYGR